MTNASHNQLALQGRGGRRGGGGGGGGGNIPLLPGACVGADAYSSHQQAARPFPSEPQGRPPIPCYKDGGQDGLRRDSLSLIHFLSLPLIHTLSPVFTLSLALPQTYADSGSSDSGTVARPDRSTHPSPHHPVSLWEGHSANPKGRHKQSPCGTAVGCDEGSTHPPGMNRQLR